MNGGSIRLQQSTTINMEELKTSLVLASKSGNLSKVRYLVEEAQVDVEQRGEFLMNNVLYFINGTALHAAVINGRTQVVSYLVDGCKVNIDAKTTSIVKGNPYGYDGSTALHFAVSHLRGDVQKEIVTCLLNHGADWAIVNDRGKQCWEMTRNVELTKLLIQYGVGFDSSRNAKSLNIAHVWAGMLNDGSAEVIALAIDKGIDIYQPDNQGSTPLMIAAVGEDGKPNKDVFETILKLVVIGESERIAAFELMGATLISDYKLDGYQYLDKAMELQWYIYGPIPKPQLSDDIQAAFDVTFEVHITEELERIGLDFDLLKVKAHLIRLRILGLKHSETMRCLASDALDIRYEEPQKFFNYLHLILKGIESTEQRSWLQDYCRKLFDFSIFALKQNKDSTPPATVSLFNNAMPILRKLVSLLNDNHPYLFSIDFILDAIVNLTHILLHSEPLTSQESTDLKNYLSQAVCLRKRNNNGEDLFLLACSDSEVIFRENDDDEEDMEDEEEENDDILRFRRCPSAKTISIFIEVGCDIDSVSDYGDTAFHVLARGTTSFECMRSPFEELYQAGVHLDKTNSQGKTMLDILRDRDLIDTSIIPACLLKFPSLECLSARLVPRNQISLLKQHIPALFESVMWHVMH